MDAGDALITSIKGVGSKTAELFKRLDVVTINDLIEYYPRDYKEYSDPVTIDSIRMGQTVAIEARVTQSLSILGRSKKKIITCKVSDGTGELSLTWFNALFLKNIIKKGERFVFYGKISKFNNQLSMEHPEYFTLDEYRVKREKLTPIYAKTAGLTDKTITKLVREAFGGGIGIREYLLPEVLDSLKLCDLDYALRQVHFPDSYERLEKARKRIAFDELFFFLLEVKSLKALSAEEGNTHKITDFSLGKGLINNLPYKLTKGQKETLLEIENDLSSDHVMRRIIQGDVGSGKTIVAIISMMYVCSGGFQSAMMAPTEVLATQHYEAITELFEKNNIDLRVALLTGSTKKSEKNRIYEELLSGEIDIVVGTHAVIQDTVDFNNLGLVITDEQHRFGVKQRESFAKKGQTPHVIVMSATPIPRTLGLILYGDMDISVIKDMPSNRLPIKNCVVPPASRGTSYNFIKKEIEKGHQAYIICPLVEESEDLDICDVITYSQDLKQVFPSDVVIEYLHGRMKNDEKNDIMDRFSKGEINILVSTTVIEVGINVPNATVILIENANRFGLAALHQLRGRVGRGANQSYCIMINTSSSEDATKRLDILNKSNDGFFIASEDLKQRGMGDMLGIRQSGEMTFKMADIYEDADILKLASRLADDVLPSLTKENASNNEFTEKIYKKYCDKLNNSKIDAL